MTDEQATEQTLKLTEAIVSFLGDQPPTHPGIIHLALATALGTGLKVCAGENVEQIAEHMIGVIREIIGLPSAKTLQ
jgi:hypothetical protein